MAIPESQLDTWSHQGAMKQSRDTYATVKNALEAKNTKYADKAYEVFLQGSYGNDTNIYAESDVDVVIRLDDLYYYDISELNATDNQIFNSSLSEVAYDLPEFKTDVIAALRRSFDLGKIFDPPDVHPGKKAIKVNGSGSRRNADVLASAQFRRYYSTANGMRHTPGICFFNSSGTRIVNYPKLHSSNCTSKHQATDSWFKPMVRVLKNMRSKLVDSGVINAGVAPSYFLEGLLYNVPNDKFGGSYGATFVAAMNWIVKAQRDKLLCAHGQHWLVRDSAAESWPIVNYTTFINAVINMWNTWPASSSAKAG
jgi:hypothetical protein